MHPDHPCTEPPRTRGECIAAACLLEVRAPKPGNVHPGAAFPDLDYGELVAAGRALAAPFDAAPDRGLGATILDCVRASRRVTRSNANLGIVLATAPLAAVAGPPGPIDHDAVERRLAGLTAADAAAVWEAIGHAAPGGMGTARGDDLAGPPPADLRAAMRSAADRDRIARLWAEGYRPLVDGLVADLDAELRSAPTVDDAIVRASLRQLAREPDSLVARRHGAEAAAAVSAEAAAALAAPDWRQAAKRLDARLRSPRRVNPGTTADLVATALYILLWEGRLGLEAARDA